MKTLKNCLDCGLCCRCYIVIHNYDSCSVSKENRWYYFAEGGNLPLISVAFTTKLDQQSVNYSREGIFLCVISEVASLFHFRSNSY